MEWICFEQRLDLVQIAGHRSIVNLSYPQTSGAQAYPRQCHDRTDSC
jgi:hypothetical protein